MKHIQYIAFALCAVIIGVSAPVTADARTNYYNGAYPASSKYDYDDDYNYDYSYSHSYYSPAPVYDRAALIKEINRLLALIESQYSYSYKPAKNYLTNNGRGSTYWTYYDSFYDEDYDDEDDDRDLDDDAPEVDTLRVGDVTDYSAELRGEVDMNDYSNGYAFFVYGEDEDMVEEIEDEYDEYSDIDQEGDDLRKLAVDSDVDDSEEYETYISGLDEDTEYYFSFCVEFEDDDDDALIICGGVEDFETDN